MIMYTALKRNLAPDSSRRLSSENQTNGQDGLISLLIHDVFGGEILKAHKKKDWHFYNRIDSERVDFTKSEIQEPVGVTKFEDIPSTPDETYDYFDHEDYSTFFMKFVRAFEETIGLDKYNPGYSV